MYSMETKQCKLYQSPVIVVLELYPEGVLCNSNELLEENDGIW